MLNQGTAMTQKRWKRRLCLVAILLIACIVGGELFARYYLGLGDPPLSMSDPDIEYLFKPSQDVSRFGNQVRYNAYSMRSDAFPKTKSEDEALRVLVLGDSIVNGGSLTDQADLATELLKAKLTEQLGKKVQVGNISAGSWGPGNLTAYLNKHGLFDADLFLLVLSSHDAADTPTFEPLVGVSPAFPNQKPILALEEAVIRYLLPRILPREKKASDQSQPTQDPATEEDFIAIDDFNALVRLIQNAQIPIVLLQHPERKELIDGYKPGYQALADAADRLSVPRIDLAPYLQAAIDNGQTIYRDQIHPNKAGQAALFKALYDAVSQQIGLESTTNQTD